MIEPWPCLAARPGGCRLDVSVSPNARRTAADGLYDGALRVRLAAPPVDGKANAASLDDIQSWYVEQGVLPAKQPMDKVLDTAFASAANAALGPFTPINSASQKPGCR